MTSSVAAAPWGYQMNSRVPLPACFVMTTLADGTPVVTFTDTTKKAILAGLDSEGWTTNEVLGPAITSIFPGGKIGASATAGMRAAALVANLYVDADLGLKVGQTGTAPQRPAFVAISLGNIIPPALNPDNDADVLSDVSEAVRCLDPKVPGMQYVLFARMGEVF